MGKADDRKAPKRGADQAGKTKQRKDTIPGSITTSRRGDWVTIVIEVHARDAVPLLRSVVRDAYGSDLALDGADAIVELLPGSLPEGRPRKADDELLRRYDEFLAGRKNPTHGTREFARRIMGVETDRDIRAVVEALRRARMARNSR